MAKKWKVFISMNTMKKLIKRICLFFTVAAVFLICVVAGTNMAVRVNTKNKIISIDKAASLDDVDCILVLGASVKPDGTPSLMLKDRINKGVEAYDARVSPKIIMSGDHGGKYYNEVEVMKRYANASGVPTEDIFMDHAGFSTYESMYRAKHIFGVKKMVIVTQRYHLYRAIYIANMLGIEAYGVATEDVTYSGQTYRDVREVLAITKDFCKSIIKPKASIMGESIDIKGDGNVTNDRPYEALDK